MRSRATRRCSKVPEITLTPSRVIQIGENDHVGEKIEWTSLEDHLITQTVAAQRFDVELLSVKVFERRVLREGFAIQLLQHQVRLRLVGEMSMSRGETRR
jgi:hypothetical protein